MPKLPEGQAKVTKHEQHLRYYAKHKDKVIEYVTAYNREHKHEINAKRRERYHARVANARTVNADNGIIANIANVNAPANVLGAIRMESKTGKYIVSF